MMKLIKEFMKKMKREGHFWKVIQSNIGMDNYQLKSQELEKYKID